MKSSGVMSMVSAITSSSRPPSASVSTFWPSPKEISTKPNSPACARPSVKSHRFRRRSPKTQPSP